MTKKIEEKLKEGINHNSSNFFYVGIGASAGGLEAIEKFLSNVPEKSGMAFLIVQHLDPIHKSALVEILSRSTSMEVFEVQDGVKVLPDHVYIIPPNKDMGILNGKLQLMEPIHPHGLRMPINYFFTSLAEDQKEKSIGIILSGYGTDGSIGLKTIKANGGIIIAQDPSTAGSEGMPLSAINTEMVDIVLKPEEMPEKLISYIKSSSKILKNILTPKDETIQAMRKIFILIRNRTGHDFSQYKKSTINRRIGRRMSIHQIKEMPQYLRYLQETPHEIDLLFKEFLINVTHFFRDPEAFESLKQEALKDIIKKPDLDNIRVWVPACSSGEEAYSIAIIIKELLEETNKQIEVIIFATDLDEEAIKTARSGTYPISISVDVSPERLNKFFYKKDNLYTIKNEIREMVIFSNQNAITDPPFTNLDLISCRNLLIYLETDAQEKILSKFNYSLKKDGILFLGPSESIGEFLDSFHKLDKKWKIYKNIKTNGFVYQFVKTYPIHQNQYSPIYSDSHFDKNSKQESVGLDITAITEKRLINIYAPPSVLINNMGEILYIHGRLGKYIEPSPGRATNMNILEMAKKGIKLGLSSAIHEAISKNKDVIMENLTVDEDGEKDHFIKLVIKPLNEPEAVNGLLIVSFEESQIQEDGAEDQIKLDPLSKSSEHSNALENELNLTKERLNHTIEELTTSNEELKSANEELQSMNEESQSTNEELETSKEELQSINEELSTVNTELQIKIDELSRINDDMNNLFNSTEIATIFVDNELNIRRFTEEATKLIKLIQSDVGRPLSDITSSIEYPELVDDIHQVVKKVAFKEKEVNTKEGEWYKVRIMPYKTSQNVIDGATITFINVSNIKNIQEKIQSALNYAEDIINTIREPLIVLNQQLEVVSANKSFYKTFNLKKSLVEGEKLYKIGDEIWNIPSLRNLLEDVLQKENEMDNYEFEHNFPKLGHKKMVLNARRIYRGDIGTELILLAMEEINTINH
jgi:two-component system, chemotaxis family, CheB/CheR fusion protein